MTDRHRVLVLNHFAAPLGQAGGTRHVELFSRLEGWDHLIIASDLNPQTGQRVTPGPGFSVVPVTPYSSNGIRRVLNWCSYGVRAFLLGVRQRKVDVVYGSSPHLLAAAAAWLISAVRRKPFVVEVRDLWPKVLVDMGQLTETSLVYRVLHHLEGFLYGRAETIVILAEGSRPILEARGVPADKIVCIPNAADPAGMEPSASRAELRIRYGFTRFTALYAGAHGPANGLDLLLDAAGDLRGDDVDIVLVGGGVLKSALMNTAKSRDLSNVRFLDPVPKTEMPDLLAAADVGLHVLADVELFRTAVSPNKVFDYMAAGLPVVSNSPGVVAETISAAKCGYGVSSREIAVGLRNAYDAHLRGELSELGRSGRRWIGLNQSRTHMANRLETLLGDLSNIQTPRMTLTN